MNVYDLLYLIHFQIFQFVYNELGTSYEVESSNF